MPRKPKNASDAKLTPEVINTICAYIRAGAFPHVAAEASGCAVEEFERWLARGTRPRSQGVFRALADGVRTAQAQARIAAEIKVKEDDPLAWLTRGPGKETAHRAGWTTATKPTVRESNQQINILLDPQMQGIFGAILQILAPFPAARSAVAQALAGDIQSKESSAFPPLAT